MSAGRESSQAVEPVATPGRAMFLSLVSIGLLCGLLIAGAYEATKPVIEKNRAEALERAIFQVVPGASQSASFVRGADDTFVSGKAPKNAVVHAAYAQDGSLLGLAIEASGMGYQDIISMLYGYSLERQAIVGMAVLSSRETPGLGDRIESDPGFLRNFSELDVSVGADGEALAHPLTAVKPGQKTEPYEIDTITGATVSSSAVARILAESSQLWVPLLRRRAADFARRQP